MHAGIPKDIPSVQHLSMAARKWKEIKGTSASQEYHVAAKSARSFRLSGRMTLTPETCIQDVCIRKWKMWFALLNVYVY